MKNILFLILFAFCITSVKAQLKEKTWLVGGDGSFIVNLGDNVRTSNSINIRPNIGYFLSSKFAVGATGGVGYSWDSSGADTSIFTFRVGPFIRYYLLNPENKINVFAEFGGEYITSKYRESTQESGTGYRFKVGPSIFLNESVGLEIAFNYAEYQGDFFNMEDDPNWFVSLGFQIHIFDYN